MSSDQVEPLLSQRTMEAFKESFEVYRNEWNSLSSSRKIFAVVSIIILVDLLVALAVIAFFDDLHIFAHLWVASIIISLLYFTFGKVVWVVDRRLNRKASHSDPISLWTYTYSFLLFYVVLSWLPFSGIPMAIVNLCSIFSAVPLICHPFKMMLPGTYSGFATAGVVTMMVTNSMNWLLGLVMLSVCLPIFLYEIWPNRTHELMLSEEEIEKRDVPTVKKALLSIGSLLLFTASMTIVSFWVILSMNYFWINAEEVSKYETLHRYPSDISLHATRIQSEADLSPYRHLSNPVVIKPNVCTTSSRNVRICKSYDCLVGYMRLLKSDKSPEQAEKLSWVIQDFCPKEEGVVFYYKYPYFSKGSIKNVGMRHDARRTRDDLTAQYFPREYRQASPEMTAFFDDLASRIPGFTGGRFDIMMDSWEAASHGNGIYVLETNVFPLDSIDEKVFDSTEFLKSIRRSFRKFRTQLMQVWFGIYNILAGYQRSIWVVAYKFPNLVERYELCDHNFEHILAKP